MATLIDKLSVRSMSLILLFSMICKHKKFRKENFFFYTKNTKLIVLERNQTQESGSCRQRKISIFSVFF